MVNKTRIQYVTHSWNVCTGCTRNCSYCFARKIARAEPPYEGLSRLRDLYLKNKWVAKGCDPADPFSPRFWPERLKAPMKVKKPARILTCDMGDLLDEHIPDRWINHVLSTIRQCDWHTFLLLTKNPRRYRDFKLPDNVWAGMTIDTSNQVPKLKHLLHCNAKLKFISFEPLLSSINISLNRIDWIIIGQQTKPDKVPRYYWVEKLVYQADTLDIPVFVKPPLEYFKERKEIPK